MDDYKYNYLQAMDIDVWQLRKSKTLVVDGSQQAADDWQILAQQVRTCEACALAKTRTQTVFGVGYRQAELLLVGEAPGAQEDAQGEPFVGRAGKLLDAMLAAIGLHRQDIYIANILKCRPPNNRDPLPEEVATCTPFLDRQVAMLQPKVIVALGRIAAHYLLKTQKPLSELRRQQWQFGNTNIPLLVTYHPAYLLRSPRDKSKSLHDLLTIQKLLRLATDK